MKTTTFRPWLTLFAATTLLAPAAPAQEITYAERLGFPAGKKVIVLHVDDAGMSHESNQGTIRAMEQGIASSTSVMMPCGWVPAFMAYLQQRPTTDAGVHLTLTSEWSGYRWGPLVGCERAPGLCDPQGAFWSNVADVVAHASPAEVEAEIRAQIARYRSFGGQPTHLDAHMGTLFQPKFVQTYLKVGIQERIPVLFPGGHATLIAQETNMADAMRPMLRQLGQQLWNAGLPVFDDLDGTSYGWTPAGARLSDKELQQSKTKRFIDLLKRARPGLTYVILHATDAGDGFRAISDSGPTRRGDMLAMLDPALKQFIEQEGIIITTWRELSDRRAKAK